MTDTDIDEKYDNVAVNLTGNRWVRVNGDIFFEKHDSLAKILKQIKSENDEWPLHNLCNKKMHDYVYKMADYLINESRLSFDDLTHNQFGIFNDMPGKINQKNKYPLLLFESFSIARSRLLLQSLDYSNSNVNNNTSHSNSNNSSSNSSVNNNISNSNNSSSTNSNGSFSINSKSIGHVT